MVHRGPARGCQKCKERHVKCDQERPECRQCRRLGFACPGYRHSLDVVLRDQTASVSSRYGRTKSSATSRAKLLNSFSPAESLPGEVAYSLEAQAVGYLFLVKVFTPARDWRTSHGHLDFLSQKYLNSPADSPLAHVTTWLAVLTMGTCSHGRPFPAETALLSKAIRSVYAAISCPEESLKDDTLMAVVLLGYGEHVRDRQQGYRARSKIHQAGAEALIRGRARLNFQSRMSLGLFDAVRHNAFNIAVSNSENALALDLWELNADVRPICDSYTPATELDACGITLIALMHKIEAENQDHDVSLRERLLHLQYRLISWRALVPDEWWPQRIGGNKLNYRAYATCYLVNQWYLLQLSVSHLIKRLDIRLSVSESLDLNFSQEIEWIDSIVASEHSFFNIPPGGPRPNLSLPTLPKICDNAGGDPCLTLQQCHHWALGARLLRQTLQRLETTLSMGVEYLHLPNVVMRRYSEVLAWAERERMTIKTAYPMTEG